MKAAEIKTVLKAYSFKTVQSVPRKPHNIFKGWDCDQKG